MLLAAGVQPGTIFAIVAVGAVAGTASVLLTGRGLLVPTVVVELLLGVLIGPQVLGLEVTEFTRFLSALGLGMLFFFAGYEIDLKRIAGEPLRLALIGWGMSLAVASAIGGVLAWAGSVRALI
jgi:Kef-type K+ transport system membrane component KefB